MSIRSPTTAAVAAFALDLLFDHLTVRGPQALGPQDSGVSVDPNAVAPAPAIDLDDVMTPAKEGV